MRITNLQKTILSTLAMVFIVSCSISTNMDSSLKREIEAVTKLKEIAKTPTKTSNSDLIKVKNDIWLGDTSEIEYEGEPLPNYLEEKKGVTLISNRPITLFEIGDMINKVTSISIRYSADLEKDVLKNANKNKPSPKQVNADWADPSKMLLSYQGPLSGLLDEVTSRFGLWWKYEKNEIHFYKFITKTFVVYSLPTKPSMNVNVGGSASGSGGSASISMTTSAQIELWGTIEKTIKSMVGKDSKISMAPSDGTISLTATPIDIRKVAKYINEQNRRLSRQVAVSVKVLQVSISDKDNYGLNITAGFDDKAASAVEGAVAQVAESFTQISSSNATDGAALGLSLLSGNWSADAALKAISEQNTTSLVTSGTVTTMNNKPAPIQVMRTQNYISEITKTNSGSDGDSSDISVTTEEIEVGFTMDVLPRILDHGRMLIMFNMTLSDLVALEKVSFGKKEDDQYIQNPIIESRGFTQEVTMKSGETLVLSGYEKVDSSTKKTGVGSATNSLLGGTADANKSRTMLVILLTPVILDNPLSPESRIQNN